MGKPNQRICHRNLSLLNIEWIVALIILLITRPVLAVEETLRFQASGLQFSVAPGVTPIAIQPAYFDNEGNNYMLGAVRSQITDDQTARGDGKVSLKMTFDMPAGPDYYSGWYLLYSEGIIDLSNRIKIGFDLKATPGIDPSFVQVGIRSNNVSAGSNRAKVFLSELGIRKFPADQFIHIEIPTALLLEKEPYLDLKRIKETFIIGLVSPDKPIQHESLWLSGLSWEWGYTRVEKMIGISSRTLFDTAKWDLRQDALVALDKAVQTLENFKDRRIHIEGHADARGGDAYNMDLSRRRAQAVADYLIREANLDPARVTIEGFGKTRPVAPNDTPDHLQKNRRVEIIIERGEGVH